ncbi:hypothetical protein AGMMS49949_00570 [Alphaproteobacteria bacterium]|nr:hypothetical protein AGMMS49949_00570 [Alphaproteobacteria bacterium]GHS95595.1 hypothetical protein AGMMS50296_0210 [Alphaproteobacteria bacterium]
MDVPESLRGEAVNELIRRGLYPYGGFDKIPKLDKAFLLEVEPKALLLPYLRGVSDNSWCLRREVTYQSLRYGLQTDLWGPPHSTSPEQLSLWTQKQRASHLQWSASQPKPLFAQILKANTHHFGEGGYQDFSSFVTPDIFEYFWSAESAGSFARARDKKGQHLFDQKVVAAAKKRAKGKSYDRETYAKRLLERDGGLKRGTRKFCTVQKGLAFCHLGETISVPKGVKTPK